MRRLLPAREALTWRSRLKGRHELKVSLRRKALINVGQLGCVKLLPNPPSKGCGNDAPALGALIIGVAEESAEEVEATGGATIEDGDPVAVDASALAVEEKVGLAAADEAVVEEGVEGGASADDPKRSPFCRRWRSTTGDGRRSMRIPPFRIDLSRPSLRPDSHGSTALTGRHTAANSRMAERSICVSVSGIGAYPRLHFCKHLRSRSPVAAA